MGLFYILFVVISPNCLVNTWEYYVSEKKINVNAIMFGLNASINNQNGEKYTHIYWYNYILITRIVVSLI